MTRIALAAWLAAVPLLGLSAQGRAGRAFLIGLYAGGYDHLFDLNAAQTADFKPGYSVGLTAGVQLSDYVGVHGDFAFARNTAEGASSFAGRDFNRFFYGAHLELSYPFETGLTPYTFLGGGTITIDQVGPAKTFGAFTKPAGLFGFGFFYVIPRTRFKLEAELKNVVFKWDRGGFDHTQWDYTYTTGLAYRVAW